MKTVVYTEDKFDLIYIFSISSFPQGKKNVSYVLLSELMFLAIYFSMTTLTNYQFFFFTLRIVFVHQCINSLCQLHLDEISISAKIYI